VQCLRPKEDTPPSPQISPWEVPSDEVQPSPEVSSRLKKIFTPRASVLSFLLLKFQGSSTHLLHSISPHSFSRLYFLPIISTLLKPSYTMAATRMFAPKVASLMASASAKVARPVIRSSVKAHGSQRAFSGTFSLTSTSHTSNSY